MRRIGKENGPCRLTSIHVIHGRLCFFGFLIINVRKETRVFAVYAIHRHLDAFDLAVDGEYFGHVVLGDVARQATDVHFGRLRCRTALAPTRRFGL